MNVMLQICMSAIVCVLCLRYLNGWRFIVVTVLLALFRQVILLPELIESYGVQRALLVVPFHVNVIVALLVSLVFAVGIKAKRGRG